VTQALAIIQRAFRLLGVAASGESNDASEVSDALSVLNDMLAHWAANESLTLYSKTQFSFPVVAALSSFTIGPTGNVVAPSCPAELTNIFVRAGVTDYGVTPITSAGYANIANKSQMGYPTLGWYDPSLSNGKLTLWPGASAGQTVYFAASLPIGAFVTANDTMTIPNNYFRAMAYCLALDLAPEYGMEAPASVQRVASAALRDLKRANAEVPHMFNEAAYLSDRASRFNIIANQ